MEYCSVRFDVVNVVKANNGISASVSFSDQLVFGSPLKFLPKV